MNMSIILASGEPDFMIKGIFSYELFGHEVWITTTHVSVLIVMILLLVFSAVVNAKLKKTDPYGKPPMIVNIAEFIVEFVNNMAEGVMGNKAAKFFNYIATIAIFILISNISGLLGLRPPTADYGVTFPLGVLSFCLITFNKFKWQKPSGVLKGLCDPWPFWLPINLIGDFAVPISLSLRLFANILSGTVMMALYYGLLPFFVKVGIPSALHVYFDLFSGAIQTYVFCMLTMTYISDAIGEG
ncbi:MAG: F0F1 ATP synthase subunit A [Lachnospiraceae bacterium]|nr:F0F1 ATP synthase subunit A [Lachnospiraceae bacterium]